MRIRFWGVRGSIASPGPDTAAVGGNTSCVEVRVRQDAHRPRRGHRPARRSATSCSREGQPLAMTLLLSHYHWDHIQGLPFFVPVYMQQTEAHDRRSRERRHVACARRSSTR